MLTHLYISQYALIDTLDLDVASGFVVITGETGAGKSVIMGALGLVMGDRADTTVVRNGATKSVVEATFVLDDGRYKELFDEAGLDYQQECLVRREITAAGKSRTFINDTPVTLNTLRRVAENLIDVHSQYENLLLKDSHFQLSVVDISAQHDDELARYGELFDHYNQCKEHLQNLVDEAERMSSEREYMQYQFDRLEEAAIEEDEQTRLEEELERINHAEELKVDLGAAVDMLDSDEYGVVGRLKEIVNRVAGASRYMTDMVGLNERLESLYIELKDVDNELGGHFESLEYDPMRKEYVESRLDTIYSLEQKHRVTTCAEIVELHRSLAGKLQKIDTFDQEIADATKALEESREELARRGAALTSRRRSVSADIAEYLRAKLVLLGMPHASVKIDITPLSDYSRSGIDDVQFLFSANKNMPLRPVVSVASGGEVARVMLALKSLIVKKAQLSTIVFDEIDTGVSGEIAGRMAEMMADMAHYVQVITITHLPQIAAAGSSHYKVFKTDSDVATTTHISELSRERRISEIAEMLSGKNPTATALKTAEELISAHGA